MPLHEHAASLSCYLYRPNEGSLRFNVEFTPMGSPNFEPGRPTEQANELARLVERGLRETKAVDLEALCVLAGRKVRRCLSSLSGLVLATSMPRHNICCA